MATSEQPEAAAAGEPARPINLCRNCGAPAPGNFCPECGQETATDPLTLDRLYRGWFARFLARDGLLWQTLSKLLLAPGALTLEYMAGRRARYLRPLKLYLATSVLVFAAVPLFGLNLGLRFFGDSGLYLMRSSRLAGAEAQGLQVASTQFVLERIDTPGLRRFRAMSPDERFNLLRARRAPYAPYFILFLVPLFALALRPLYRNRHRSYTEHLVFGLHCQTFLLFMLLLEARLPAVPANLVTVWVIAYLALALKRVYGGSWAETLARGAVAMVLYLGMFLVANLLLVLALIAF